MERVLLVGGSGMVGSWLQKKLLEHGYSVAVLSRSPSNTKNVTTYLWNVKEKTIDEQAITTANYIINLAGAGIANKRWTSTRKQELIASRVDSTQLLIDTIIKTNAQPKAFVTASAVGYYGSSTTEKCFVEEDRPANDFLGNCCKLWEDASSELTTLGVKRVVLRIGVVLAKNGGMLSKIKPIFNLGLGAAMGSGKQFVPWVHINDLCACFIKAIENPKMKGVYNAVAPNTITNHEFSSELAKSLKKPFWMPRIPKKVIYFMMGEMAVLITEGSGISCQKLLSSGFVFKYPKLKKALRNICPPYTGKQMN